MKVNWTEKIEQGSSERTVIAFSEEYSESHCCYDEKFFQATIESVRDGILVTGENGRILYWNRPLIVLFDISDEDARQKNHRDLWDLISRKIQNPEYFAAGSNHCREPEEKKTDSLFLTNGKIVECFSSPLAFSGSVMGRVWSFREITEKKRLETQLLQSQKMEAIGTLAAGVAHDFNNILMTIQGCTSLLLMDHGKPEQDYRRLREIEKHIKTASDLTQQLLGFAGKALYSPQSVDIGDLIKNTVYIFGRTRNEVVITQNHPDRLWNVMADPIQIEQVILNLLFNACQALPSGGVICIETENTSVENDDSGNGRIDPGRYVKVVIRDNGVGMDKTTQKRIFDPFFTTHQMGRGSGLGLATVYGIIQKHGGAISVISEQGEGAVFTFYLPADQTPTIMREVNAAVLMNGSETIMIIDDEEMVLDVGTAMLNKMGYQVLAAENGQKAVEIYEKNSRNIDLIILDMIMPSLNGKDTYKKLKAINPDLKVILSSGYSLNEQAMEILNCGCDDFIQKPFNMAQLSEKVRQILN